MKEAAACLGKVTAQPENVVGAKPGKVSIKPENAAAEPTKNTLSVGAEKDVAGILEITAEPGKVAASDTVGLHAGLR